MRKQKILTAADVLRKAQREAMNSQWELLLLQQMRAERLPVPEREHQFALPRKWAFDFAWPDAISSYGEHYKIAVEVEGGTGKGGVSCGRCKGSGRVWFSGRLGDTCNACKGSGRLAGRHNSSEGYENDLEKYNTAAWLGWMVYRFSSEMIKDGRAIKFLAENVFKFHRR